MCLESLWEESKATTETSSFFPQRNMVFQDDLCTTTHQSSHSKTQNIRCGLRKAFTSLLPAKTFLSKKNNPWPGNLIGFSTDLSKSIYGQPPTFMKSVFHPSVTPRICVVHILKTGKGQQIIPTATSTAGKSDLQKYKQFTLRLQDSPISL